jgi:CDP-6-deoxy-D-xylo-4-hexulose-3-dehydrase
MDQIFSRVDGVKAIQERKEAQTSWFGAPYVCDSSNLKRSLVAHLEKSRVQTRNYFAGNLLLQPAYKKYGNWKDYPNASQVLSKVFFVGVSPTITNPMIDYVRGVVESFNE